MLPYIRLGKAIVNDLNLVRPHVKTENITKLNFNKMKEMGMEKVIFSEMHTLIKPKKTVFSSPEIKESFTEAVNVFGEKNIAVMNSFISDKS